MKKEQLLEKIEKAWEGFQASYAGLTADEMLQPGVTEDWSVKDILAHVTWWEQESLEHLPTILQGNQPPRYSVRYGGIDAFNAHMTELKRSLSLAEVQEQLKATHKMLVDYLQSVPEEQFNTETRFRRRLGWDSYKHYPLHAEAIRAWREQSG